MPRLHAKLTLVGKHPKEIPVRTSPFLLGRSEECHLALTGGGKVSRKHAEIKYGDGEFRIADLGSHNGTQVNGKKIIEQPLENGDKITIGGFVIQVEITIEDKDGKVYPGPRSKHRKSADGAPAPHPKPAQPPARTRPQTDHDPGPQPEPVVVVAPPPEEEGTKFVDMAALVGPPQGEGGTAIVDMADITGVKPSPGPSKRVVMVGAAVGGFVFLVLVLKLSGILEPEVHFEFADVMAAYNARAAGTPVPPGSKVPEVEHTYDRKVVVGETVEQSVIFAVAAFGASDPKVAKIEGVRPAPDEPPDKLLITGLAPGRIELILEDPEAKKYFGIGIEVLADKRWPPGWTDRERRDAADKLKEEADRIFDEAKQDVTDRSKALSRYTKVVRIYESMASPPPTPFKQAKQRVEEITKQVVAAEEQLLKQYKAAQGRKRYWDMYQNIIHLLEIYPIEGSSRDEEVFKRHGNWEKFNLYTAEQIRLQYMLYRSDPVTYSSFDPRKGGS